MLSSENTQFFSLAPIQTHKLFLSHTQQAMELFWELAFTITVSLLLPLVFIKLLGVTPNFETNEKIGQEQDHDRGVKSDFQNWETEEVVRIVGKIDEFRDKSILGNLLPPEIVDMNCGSHKIHNSEKIDEDIVYNEIELVNLVEENRVEETSHDWGCTVDESNQGVKINEVEVELMEGESIAHKVEEVEVEVSQCDRNCNEIDEYKRKGTEVSEYMGLLDEDDWEGIEWTELERCFGAAVVFVGSKSNANRVAGLSNDVKMKLYGYHRIATQGPCREPQPMTLKFSARAKW